MLPDLEMTNVVHFFDATDNIDPLIKEMLNHKLQRMKDYINDWQLR